MAPCGYIEKEQQDFCGQRFTSIEKKLDVIVELLNGREGLIVDVDRLKESRRKQIKVLWILVGCVLTAFGEYVISFFRSS
jgi:hypothetical protein